MIPLAVMCWVITFVVLERTIFSEDSAIATATVATAALVAAYWFLLWRRSVVWSPGRSLRTFVGSLGCLAAGVLAGVMMMSLSRINDESFGIFFGGVFTIVIWLPLMVVIWKETAAERAERIRHSAGDVVCCPRCGYNMTGLYEPRCPECGAKFTLNQLYAAQRRDGIGDASEEGRGERVSG
jgi:hypothetical protein